MSTTIEDVSGLEALTEGQQIVYNAGGQATTWTMRADGWLSAPNDTSRLLPQAFRAAAQAGLVTRADTAPVGDQTVYAADRVYVVGQMWIHGIGQRVPRYVIVEVDGDRVVAQGYNNSTLFERIDDVRHHPGSAEWREGNIGRWGEAIAAYWPLMADGYRWREQATGATEDKPSAAGGITITNDGMGEELVQFIDSYDLDEDERDSLVAMVQRWGVTVPQREVRVSIEVSGTSTITTRPDLPEGFTHVGDAEEVSVEWEYEINTGVMFPVGDHDPCENREIINEDWARQYLAENTNISVDTITITGRGCDEC